MEKTLIIYDNKGNIFTQITGNFELPTGLQHIIIEIPKGKIITGVDVELKEPILLDIPKTQFELLQEENEKMKQSIADLWESKLLGDVE